MRKVLSRKYQCNVSEDKDHEYNIEEEIIMSKTRIYLTA